MALVSEWLALGDQAMNTFDQHPHISVDETRDDKEDQEPPQIEFERFRIFLLFVIIRRPVFIFSAAVVKPDIREHFHFLSQLNPAAG